MTILNLGTKFMITNKRIIIFGGSGSLGQTLINRLHKDNTIQVFSRDEAKHWTIKNKFNSDNLSFAVGDIRDRNRVKEMLLQFDPHVVIMASALKQVDTCELSPYESVQTNILGINNIICEVEDVMHRLKSLESVLMVSTDKACAPTNVYGMCKSISERLVLAKSKFIDTVKFIAVRYGNVLDSRGSILPLFKHQVQTQEFVTVTHPDMTRFLMTLDDSVDLITTALENADSGDTWIPKLKAMKIIDLAKIYADKYEKLIKFTGIRPGEKMHESLISDSEAIRTVSTDNHYIIKPSYNKPVGSDVFDYSSNQDLMNKDDLYKYLNDLNLLEKQVDSFVGKSIEEQKR